MHSEAVAALEAALTQLEQAILALQQGGMMSQPIVYNVCLKTIVVNLKQKIELNCEVAPTTAVTVVNPPPADTCVAPAIGA